MKHESSTQEIPEHGEVPRHVAIIMDGNGRWAAERGLPRFEGHRRGMEAVRAAVRAAPDLGVDYLTLFSFSSENWSRPAAEVEALFGLLRIFIQSDLAELHERGTRIRVSPTGTLEQILLGPASTDDGSQNLAEALRTAMGMCGARTIRDFQQAELVVAPSIKTEGKQIQRAQA